MSLEVAILRLYRGWLPDEWSYNFDGTTYEIRETFTGVPAFELERLQASAEESGFEVLSQNPFVCRKQMSQKEVTARLLEEFAIQAGGLGLISFSTQGAILDELVESDRDDSSAS